MIENNVVRFQYYGHQDTETAKIQQGSLSQANKTGLVQQFIRICSSFVTTALVHVHIRLANLNLQSM